MTVLDAFEPWHQLAVICTARARYRSKRPAGFDEGFRLHHEDVGRFARLHRAGYRIVLASDTLVIHQGHRASHGDLRHLRSHLWRFARYCLRYPRLALGLARTARGQLPQAPG